MNLSFEEHAADLAVGLDGATPPGLGIEDAVLETEVKVGCTQAMLLCLDREARLAFIYGDVFDVATEEAAALCEIAPATFRKRLSRARAAIRRHMTHHCGLVNEAAACRCSRRVGRAIETGRVDPNHLLFAGPSVETVHQAVAEMEQLHTASAVFHGLPLYQAPDRLASDVTRLLNSRRWSIVGESTTG